MADTPTTPTTTTKASAPPTPGIDQMHWIATGVAARMGQPGPAAPAGGEEKRHLPPGTLIQVGIDVSGSTDNRNSGPRAGRTGRFPAAHPAGAAPDSATTNLTDVIIVAEVVAVLKLLDRLDLAFHLEGARIMVSVFSDAAAPVLSGRIAAADLPGGDYSLATLRYLLPSRVAEAYSGGCTNLMSWLQGALGDAEWRAGGAPLFLILATDGVPNTGGSPAEILRHLDDPATLPEEVRARLITFAIGAGSVQTAAGGTARAISTRRAAPLGGPIFEVDGRELPDLQALTAALGVRAAECDVGFLWALMLALGHAAYLPACGDYGEFLAALDRFLGQIDFGEGPHPLPATRWKVLLEGGCPAADLGPQVSAFLSAGQPCLGYLGGARTWYLYVPQGAHSGWQVALTLAPNAGTPDNAKAHRADPPPWMRALSYGEAYSRIEAGGGFLALGGADFAVATHMGRWRCREIVAH